MKEVKSVQRRYFISREELAMKLGLSGNVTHVFYNDIEPGVDHRVEIITTEIVKNEFDGPGE